MVAVGGAAFAGTLGEGLAIGAAATELVGMSHAFRGSKSNFIGLADTGRTKQNYYF